VACAPRAPGDAEVPGLLGHDIDQASYERRSDAFMDHA
jgi:hypothetical protein